MTDLDQRISALESKDRPQPESSAGVDPSFRKGSRFRIMFSGACVMFGFMAISARLAWVCVFSQHHDPRRGFVPAPRADIVDRNGTLIATSLSTFSVYANPRLIKNCVEAAQHLANLFPGLSVRNLVKKLRTDKPFVWIARHITPLQKRRVKALGIQGISLIGDQKRVYPQGALFCHVLGLTNVDQEGICGLEKTFNERLNSSRDPLYLSVDAALQSVIVDELSKTIESFQAQGGNAILANVNTGEILAMVSLPDFSPHDPISPKSKAFFNRNVSGVYEFGSIMKIHNTAMVLDSGVATLNSVFDASAPLCIGRFKITDFRGKNRPLSVKEAFQFSSNIANAKMALSAGSARQVAFFKKMGFFAPLATELPELARPLAPAMWSKALAITSSYGYGFAITPLHVVQSVSGIVTAGAKPLSLLKATKLPKMKKVVSDDTARKIRELMALAVTDGQARKVAAEGYLVGAKTGTANLRGGKKGYHQKQNLTSCVAVFPIDAPEYVLLVCVDRPQANASTHFYATAGWIAAPLCSSIIKQVAPILGMNPTPGEKGLGDIALRVGEILRPR